MKKKILGIDPGSRFLGFALIESELGKPLRYIRSGTIKFNPKEPLIDRLGQLYQSGEFLRKEFAPDEVAIEALIYVKSVVSLRKLAEARGALIASFASHEEFRGRIFEYAPNLVKSTVSGFGHADKLSVEKALSLLFNKKIQHQTSDDSDALAVAVTHALLYKG